MEGLPSQKIKGWILPGTDGSKLPSLLLARCTANSTLCNFKGKKGYFIGQLVKKCYGIKSY